MRLSANSINRRQRAATGVATRESLACIKTRSRIISISLIIAAFLGLLLVVYLIVDTGAADVAHAMAVIGWWFVPITLFPLFPFTLAALSSPSLIPTSTRTASLPVVSVPLFRDSINSPL